MSLSIRLRLTLLYSAILAFALIVFGGALYVTVDHVIMSQAQQALGTEANSFAAALRLRPDGDVVIPPNIVAAQTTYIQLRDLNGAVASQSVDLQTVHGTLPISPGEQQIVLQGGAIQAHIASMGNTQVLLYDAPIPFFGRIAGILQMARPLRDVNGPLDTLRPDLLLGIVVATLLAFGAGWLLAGTALRPIARITQAAQAIGDARDFGRRVAHHGPRDEVGRLACTFNTMLESLEDAYQTQRRFVADASHELRTPLTSIRGNLGLLQREPPISPADRRAVLADLVSESERLSRLVSDLLTLARTDAGRPLRHEPVPIAPMLADLSRRLAAGYPERRVRYDAADNLAVEGDPDAMMQVLLILLDNALKFTPPTGSVAVAAKTADGQVTIAVRDTGPGISSEALPRIFDRFYQDDAARTGAGTGLGLAIARALVEALHGTISVESTVGRGSTFTITLPLAAPVQRPELALASGS